MKLFSSVILVIILVKCTDAQTYENASDLQDVLFLSYKKDIRPLKNQTDVLLVNLTLILFGIPDVDQVRGSVSYIIQVVTEWYDEKMTWTPADYGGVSDILVGREDVWVPPLTLSKPMKFTKIGQSWMQVAYLPDGHAIYTPSDVVEGSCSFYLEYWPFDKQVCQLALFTFGYTVSKLTLNVPGQIVNTNFYTKNGEWALDEKSFTYEIDNSFGTPKVMYNFHLIRQSTFYLLTIILPTNAISVLTCLVFLLPSESGERVSYSITIMLSLVVFMTIISDELPKTSDPVPIFCIYILFNIAISIIGLSIVILNLVIYHRDDEIPISTLYLKLVRLSRCGLCRKTSKETLVEMIKPSTPTDKDQSQMLDQKQNSIRKDAYITAKKDLPNNDLSMYKDEEMTWKKVSAAIDKIIITAMFILAFIPSIITLVFMASTSDYKK